MSNRSIIRNPALFWNSVLQSPFTLHWFHVALAWPTSQKDFFCLSGTALFFGHLMGFTWTTRTVSLTELLINKNFYIELSTKYLNNAVEIQQRYSLNEKVPCFPHLNIECNLGWMRIPLSLRLASSPTSYQQQFSNIWHF